MIARPYDDNVGACLGCGVQVAIVMADYGERPTTGTEVWVEAAPVPEGEYVIRDGGPIDSFPVVVASSEDIDSKPRYRRHECAGGAA